jgi:uncharacterized protein YfiM (DUF2279 family)
VAAGFSLRLCFVPQGPRLRVSLILGYRLQSQAFGPVDVSIVARNSSMFKKVILILIWLSFSVQVSWGDTDCDVSISFHSPRHDTLKISDKWFAGDKLEHLGVSAFLSGVSYRIFRDFYHNKKESSIYLSATLTLSGGLGKELHDLKAPGGKFSYKDLIADILGVGLGLWIATR